jgi:hypothetical protein
MGYGENEVLWIRPLTKSQNHSYLRLLGYYLQNIVSYKYSKQAYHLQKPTHARLWAILNHVDKKITQTSHGELTS